MNGLPVPGNSQIKVGALQHSNDCGATSTLDVTQGFNLDKDKTVDAVYNEIYPAGDAPLSATSLVNYLTKKGITSEWKPELPIGSLYTALMNKMPAILLIHYAPLVDAGLTERTGFRGAHFVVAVGMDIKYMYINDPYRTTELYGKEIPLTVMLQAWGQCYLDGNPNNGAVVTKIPLQDLSPIQPPLPTGSTYKWGVVNGVPVNGAHVRSGPATGYPIVRDIWRTDMPLITIITVTNGYGRLADKSGWVSMSLFVKI
jgi:hypothetical protein